MLGFGWSAEKKYNNKPKYKKQWRWCCGYRDALTFAKLMWPFAQVKLHKLEQIINHYEPRAQELGDNVVDLETERDNQENMAIEELLKEIKAYRDDMVARNYPFQEISNIITRWERKDFLEEAEKENKKLKESYEESVRQANERKE